MSSELNMTPRRAPESPMGNVSPSLGSPGSENKPKPWPGLALYGKKPARMCVSTWMHIMLIVCFCISLLVAQKCNGALCTFAVTSRRILYAANQNTVLNIGLCYKQCSDGPV